MPGHATFKVAPVVKALRIVLITLLVLYGLVFISSTLFVILAFPSFMRHTSEAGFWAEIRVFLDKVLTGPIYFFIAYCVFKLIVLISRAEPFSSASPRYIRRIGYAVFGLAAINAVVTTIFELTSPGVLVSEVIVRVLYGGLGTLLLGFGFLVIAKVLEAGVALQQDQDLTV
ncbi:MAG: DUF2975 domain-containing protein [Candidatus Aminicenantales bacterium]|jgi:hypothetical protein